MLLALLASIVGILHASIKECAQELLALITCRRSSWHAVSGTSERLSSPHNLCDAGKHRQALLAQLESAQRDDFYECKCGGFKEFCAAQDCVDYACPDCDDMVNSGFMPCFSCEETYCDSHQGGDCVVCGEARCQACMYSCSSCQQPVCGKHKVADGQNCWHAPEADSEDSLLKEERHYLSPHYDGYN